MDLTEPVIYRGLDVNDLVSPAAGVPLSGFRLDEVRMPPVQGVGYREKRSLADGYDAGRVFLGARVLYLRGTIFDETIAGLHDKMRLFRRTFSPTLAYAEDQLNHGYLPLSFSLRTKDLENFADGRLTLVSYARPTDLPGAMYPRDMAFGTDGRGFSNLFEVALDAVDPRLYWSSATEVSVASTTGSGSILNRGDYPAPLFLLVGATAAHTGARSITLTVGGSRFTVTVPAGSQDRYVLLDSAKKVATLTVGGVETLRMDLVSFAAGFTWPLIQPGSNAYDWTTVGGAPDLSPKMWFREAFV